MPIPSALDEAIGQGKLRLINRYFAKNPTQTISSIIIDKEEDAQKQKNNYFNLLESCINSEFPLLITHRFLFVDPPKDENGNLLPIHQELLSTKHYDDSSSLTYLNKASLLHNTVVGSFTPVILTKLLLAFVVENFDKEALATFLAQKNAEGKTAFEMNTEKYAMKDDESVKKALAPENFSDVDKVFHEIKAWYKDEFLPTLLKTEEALHAARDGDVATVRRLVVQEKSVDPNCKDVFGYSILHTASRECHFNVVKCLVEEGRCDISAQDYRKRTDLHDAAENDNLLCADYLLRKSREMRFVKKKNSAGEEEYDDDDDAPPEQVDPKDCPGAYIIDVQDWSGNTALHVAIEKSNARMIKLLILLGGSDYMIIKNNDGLTAWDLVNRKMTSASEEQKMDKRGMFDIFFDYDPVSKHSEWRQPNQLREYNSKWLVSSDKTNNHNHAINLGRLRAAAAANDFDEIVDVCKNYGVSMNENVKSAVDSSEFFTAFHCAIVYGHLDLVKKLIKNDDDGLFNIDLSILLQGFAPWDIAGEVGFDEISDFFHQECAKEVEEAKVKITKNKEEQKKKDEEKRRLKAAESAVKELQTEKDKRKQLEEEVKTMKGKQLEQQQRQKEECKNLREKLDKLQEELTIANNSHEVAREKLDKLQEELTIANNSHEVAREKLEKVTEELTIANNSHEVAREKLEKVTEELKQDRIQAKLYREQQLEEQKQSYEEKITELKQTLNSNQQTAEQEKLQLENEIQKRKENCDKLRFERDDTKKKLREEEQQRENIYNQFQEHKKAADEMEKSLQSKVHIFSAQLKDKTKEINSFGGKMFVSVALNFGFATVIGYAALMFLKNNGDFSLFFDQAKK